jgi:hypothetical protein
MDIPPKRDDGRDVRSQPPTLAIHVVQWYSVEQVVESRSPISEVKAMSVGIFTDKAHAPTEEQISEAIGSRRAAWEDMLQVIRERYSHQEDWRFYGKNYGWALRFRKSGKALVSLYPAEGSFTIQLILSQADVDRAHGLKLGKHVRQIIEQAHPYPEGRWVFIPVKSGKDLRDVHQLLALKCGVGRGQAKATVARKPRRPKPTARAEFMALEQQVWEELAATWRGLPDEALVRPGACGSEWSVKDVMNHIAAWQEATLEALPVLLKGDRLPAGQYSIQKFNARHYAADQDRSVTASRRRLNRSRRQLLAFLVSAPETQLLDLKSRVGTWVKYATYGHYNEHLGNLQNYQGEADLESKRKIKGRRRT